MKTNLYPFRIALGYDANGNKRVKVQVPGFRSFSVQTNGNLPETHRKGLCPTTALEVKNWIKQFGTEKQKEAVDLIV